MFFCRKRTRYAYRIAVRVILSSTYHRCHTTNGTKTLWTPFVLPSQYQSANTSHHLLPPPNHEIPSLSDGTFFSLAGRLTLGSVMQLRTRYPLPVSIYILQSGVVYRDHCHTPDHEHCHSPAASNGYGHTACYHRLHYSICKAHPTTKFRIYLRD